MVTEADIAANLTTVRRRIDAAAQRSDRAPSDIRLVAVSKTFPADAVGAAMDAGQRDYGENRVQEGLDKIEKIAGLAAGGPSTSVEWHLIGHLQSNKAKRAAAAFAWIHSIDSVDLLRKVDEGAIAAGTHPRLLIQVDLANEATKFGADEAALAKIVAAALEMKAATLNGLMIVPPIANAPEDARPWFRRLREIRDQLIKTGAPADHLHELSMGMSHDFEVAIEEGATIVRVGSAIFGRRPAPPA